ncbi:DUF3854 domain-containing protein [Mycobacterium koreense]|uniref:Uncharacterized protein n=1 Tax=Mycolicibacillus koreensis TaxID=1069220 RepID=A0A7I7SGU6_9MYCO|nr:phage/plasmid primase, P4 family [Mycolicibacillus koreensis]MCV7247924.1 DUF3854 domain-containing protein [Mycolicibacillus koreensis]OSC24503.1 hypothetical protein B8W67_19515 [Mycolicibacillus koreensis]BBY56167.1 hypothetical protein MKOR_34180 [Mycolicibacillus koreensis]
MSDNPTVTPDPGTTDRDDTGDVQSLPGQPLLDDDRERLTQECGLTEEFFDEHPDLVRSVRSSDDLVVNGETPWSHLKSEPCGVIFVWTDLDGHPQFQYRPDTPAPGEGKYQFLKGAVPTYGVIRQGSEEGKLLLVEGHKKSMTAASLSAEVGDTDTWIVGLPSCTSWSEGEWSPSLDLVSLADDRDMIICMDADAAHNRAVYDGAAYLAEALSNSKTTRFMRVPGGGKSGLDDVFAALPPERRAASWVRLLDRTQENKKPADRRPEQKKGKGGNGLTPEQIEEGRRKAAERAAAAFAAEEASDLSALDRMRRIESDPIDPSPWCDPESGSVLPSDVSVAIVGGVRPVHVDAAGEIRVYSSGYFQRGDAVLQAEVRRYLGNKMSSTVLATVKEHIRALCQEYDLILPATPSSSLLPVENGMLDAVTGRLFPHDPKYKSLYKLHIKWNPKATCPTYERWLESSIGPHQIEVFEESMCQIVCPTSVPDHVPFLFGKSRSGKSTATKLVRWLLDGRQCNPGSSIVAAVTLQQLSDHKHASAELYGKAACIAGDMSAKHINDLAPFKQVTGDDPIQSDKKFGQMFAFVNRAQFYITANQLPTVRVDDAEPYLNRIRPIAFPKSFAGREDKTLDDKLYKELEGIFARWVRAYQSHVTRDRRWLQIHPAVYGHFAADTDRVGGFVHNCCTTVSDTKTVLPLPPRQVVTVEGDSRGKWPINACATLTELHSAFLKRVEFERGSEMQLSTFRKALENVPGVLLDQRNRTRDRVSNLVIKPQVDWTSQQDVGSLASILFDEPEDDEQDETPEPLVSVPAPATSTSDGEEAPRRFSTPAPPRPTVKASGRYTPRKGLPKRQGGTR